MSQKNVDVVRRGYDAVNHDGVDGALPFFDPEIELVPIPEGLPDPEHFHGHDGVRAWFEKIGEVFAIQNWEPHEFIDAEDRMLVRVTVRGRFRETDIPGELTLYQVWTVRGARALRLESYLDRTQALEAAGLSE